MGGEGGIDPTQNIRTAGNSHGEHHPLVPFSQGAHRWALANRGGVEILHKILEQLGIPMGNIIL
jgi:hypothetical protein